MDEFQQRSDLQDSDRQSLDRQNLNRQNLDSQDEFDRGGSSADQFEATLRAALRPLPAPEGFADRVLARAQNLQAAEPPAFPKRHGLPPLLRWSVAAVLLLAVAVGGFTFHRRERRIAGERARDQVLLALRITSFTIRAMRDQTETDNHNRKQQQETP